ncbi:MAG TPA: hypothetical protein VNG33_13495 [Polyangiaceae bacterium]|nr:hypothetical protein [Polyangiaceae bacterium]
MTKHSQPVLGIDIGRVIIGAADSSGTADTSFLSGNDEAALATPASDGAFDAIAELTRAFAGRVWLVSKCGPRIQQLTRRWLQRHAFYERTGVRQDRVRFCLKRPEKRDHCAAIGATHFVDDRLDVLEHLVGLVPQLYWFGYQTSTPRVPEWAKPVHDWQEARGLILSQVQKS